MSEIKFTREFEIYSAKQQGVYPIQELDWTRLKRNITRIIPRKKIFEILASFSFGVAASAILAIIAFKSTKDLPPWVLPTTWALLVTSSVLGIGFIILDNQQKELITASVNEVLDEMKFIEENFTKS